MHYLIIPFVRFDLIYYLNQTQMKYCLYTIIRLQRGFLSWQKLKKQKQIREGTKRRKRHMKSHWLDLIARL